MEIPSRDISSQDHVCRCPFPGKASCFSQAHASQSTLRLSLGISHPSSTGVCSLLTAHQVTVSPKASAVTHRVLPLTPYTALPSGSLFLGLTLYDFPTSSLFPFNQALAHRLYNRTRLPSLLPSCVSTVSISPPSGPLLQLYPSPSTFHSPLTIDPARIPLLPSAWPRSPHNSHVHIFRPSLSPSHSATAPLLSTRSRRQNKSSPSQPPPSCLLLSPC